MKFTILLTIIILFTYNAYSQDDTKNTEISPQKLEKIYSLFELTNIKGEADETIDFLIDYFQQLAPNLPDGYIEGMRSEFSSDEYLSKLSEIYDKAYTEQELQSLIDFFGSDIGKKWIEKLPEISNQSYQEMQDWQAKMAIKLREKIEKDGYLNTIRNNSGDENE
jgi:hypothetical protein